MTSDLLDWRGAAFDHAPVSLWLEDYSGLKQLFDQWRAEGVRDLRAHLQTYPALIASCAAALKVVTVNQRSLQLFEAPTPNDLIRNLAQVFRDDMLDGHVDELVALWEGATRFAGQSVNYTLGGARLDVAIRGAILPGFEQDWARVLVALDDVTEREQTRRALASHTAYANGLFEHSPVSLWVEDFSGIKALLDDLRNRGITDFRTFMDVHPEFVERCMAEIRVIDVNRRTLELFLAEDKADLLARLEEVFRDDMHNPFREQLIDLWHNKTFQLREVVNYRLDGEPLYLLLQFSVLPGHEENWDLVQIALTDITARKKAEAYLEYLGTHDVLTQLYNRTYYTDELARMQRRRQAQLTVLMIDVNGLKTVNDELGHHAGDALLRRAGEVLSQAVEKPASVARIGGDEFVVLMPGLDEAAGKRQLSEIHKLLALNNQFYAPVVLEFAVGMATSGSGEPIDSLLRRADQLLLTAKRDYYADPGRSRRVI
jgi:diguanylate cyclase (GGDEF)-like protein